MVNNTVKGNFLPMKCMIWVIFNFIRLYYSYNYRHSIDNNIIIINKKRPT